MDSTSQKNSKKSSIPLSALLIYDRSMLFNSVQFLLFFLAVCTIYWIIPEKLSRHWLLVASTFFYLVLIPRYVFVLYGLIIIDYFMALALERSKTRRKLFLLISISANLGILFFFKYFDFFARQVNVFLEAMRSGHSVSLLNLLIPLGLSFHTFQSISYVVEVYRGTYKAERNFGTYALYVMFFPQLVAGPIERPAHMLPQFHRPRAAADWDRTLQGLSLIIWGLIKKVVIADNLSIIADRAFSSPLTHSPAYLLLGAVAFSIQIYCDFSGYSDMAVGIASILGFNLSRNFNLPYRARSLSEFWRRWHISLSTWFRDYVFIPLGGSRGTATETIRNTLLVFLLSGFWHGADWKFMIWGGIHGCGLIAESSWHKISSLRLGPLLSHAMTFLFVTLAWIFFRADSTPMAFFLIRHFGSGILNPGFHQFAAEWNDLLSALGTKTVIGLFVAIAWMAFQEFRPAIAGKVDLLEQHLAAQSSRFWAACGLLLYFAGRASSQQFIYFQF